MEIRSFLAFELPKEIKEVISRVSVEMRKTGLDLKWVKVDNIHLTIVFMGNIAVTLLDDMAKNISNVCRNHGPFPISITGSGFFFNRRSPTVLWIGLDSDMKRMTRFRDDLQAALTPYGIKEEKRGFKPHLTLGRFQKGAKSNPLLDELASKYKGLTSPKGMLNELALFKSDLKPGGAVYTRLNAWPLSGTD